MTLDELQKEMSRLNLHLIEVHKDYNGWHILTRKIGVMAGNVVIAATFESAVKSSLSFWKK